MPGLRVGVRAEPGGVLAGRGAEQAMLQFAGTTVDGEASAVYPPLLQSNVRY
jgi:hypothetical protein